MGVANLLCRVQIAIYMWAKTTVTSCSLGDSPPQLRTLTCFPPTVKIRFFRPVFV